MSQQSSAHRGRLNRGVTVGATSVLATALIGTAIYGVGSFDQWDEISDGTTWLWSSVSGEVIRVNPHNGQVDLAYEAAGSASHPVRIAQNTDHLVLHDMKTGVMTSVDLASLNATGVTEVEAGDNHHLVFGGDVAVVIDRANGKVQRVDPETLEPAGDALRLPGPLTGGQFDGDGVLWLGAPSQGTVVSVDMSTDQPEVIDSVGVAEPGEEFVLTVLDSGALTANRDTGDLSVVAGGSATTVAAPVDLADAIVPGRTYGSLGIVTLPDTSTVVMLADTASDPEPMSFRTHGTRPDPALPFAERVYVPHSEEGVVRVFGADGRQVETITVPDAGSEELDLEVRDEHLFINAPGSETALVVDVDGSVREVSKFEAADDSEDEDGEGDGAGTGGEYSDPGGEFTSGPDAGEFILPHVVDASTPADPTPDLPELPDLPGPTDGPGNGRNDGHHDEDANWPGNRDGDGDWPGPGTPPVTLPDDGWPDAEWPGGDWIDGGWPDDDGGPGWPEDHGDSNLGIDPPDSSDGPEAPGWPGFPPEDETDEQPEDEVPDEEPPVEKPPADGGSGEESSGDDGPPVEPLPPADDTESERETLDPADPADPD